MSKLENSPECVHCKHRDKTRVVGSNPTRVRCLWYFCLQNSGKCWVHSANTHRCMGQKPKLIFFIPDANLTYLIIHCKRFPYSAEFKISLLFLYKSENFPGWFTKSPWCKCKAALLYESHLIIVVYFLSLPFHYLSLSLLPCLSQTQINNYRAI